MKDGYYWAKPYFGDKEPQVVRVGSFEDGSQWVFMTLCMDDQTYWDLIDFEFGSHPQPIEMPDWCKEE